MEWIEANQVLLAGLAGLGLLIFVGSLVGIPLLVVYMPKDYFVRLERGPLLRGPLRRVLQVLKNLLGGVLLLGGILMLLLPVRVQSGTTRRSSIGEPSWPDFL